ncbi:uncharacterized protein [Elaeis guineensis]|uniref:Uncharacterized protein LOC105056283 n=1 Tax=Elaeis guineensis var. tenera TaxID=51953 RepID=A0A6I9S2X8_ELAGV|nr:uncharacterized protein LOC105056283 [Elaeis guineensis]
MPEHREKQPDLTLSPSFGEAQEEITTIHRESPHQIPPADRPDEEGADDDDSSDDFEFTFVGRDPVADASITADEILSNGRILPAYPVFDRSLLLSTVGEPATGVEEGVPLRRLVMEDRSSSSFEAVGEYCAWSPRSAPQTPERCKKSASTGSARRWRLRDLVVGRSHSDGKEKFVFIAASPSPPSMDKTKNSHANPKAANAPAKRAGRATELDLATAHRLYYGKGNGEKVKGGRRSFLPYRQELVGLFANVNGFSRTHHPC